MTYAQVSIEEMGIGRMNSGQWRLRVWRPWLRWQATKALVRHGTDWAMYVTKTMYAELPSEFRDEAHICGIYCCLIHSNVTVLREGRMMLFGSMHEWIETRHAAFQHSTAAPLLCIKQTMLRHRPALCTSQDPALISYTTGNAIVAGLVVIHSTAVMALLNSQAKSIRAATRSQWATSFLLRVCLQQLIASVLNLYPLFICTNTIAASCMHDS